MRSEEVNPNFQLLVVGFCRKFAMLVSDCSISPDKHNRKAAFSVAWMKMLANFQPGGSSQERLIVERFLLGQQCDSEVVYAVVSLLHELVYTHVHSLIQDRTPRAPRLSTESDESLYRYNGEALHRKMKLRRETLKQMKSRVKISSKRRGIMELELHLPLDLTLKDKSSLSHSLN